MHTLTLDRDEDGWDYAECECGWVSPPCPDAETAADFYADHRVAVERDAIANALYAETCIAAAAARRHIVERLLDGRDNDEMIRVSDVWAALGGDQATGDTE